MKRFRDELVSCALHFAFGSVILCALALGQNASPAADSSAKSIQPASKQEGEEMVTRDEPATFKVNVKLVVVRAVVRDAKGNAVGNLHQEDFQIADKGKPQVITQFEMEQPGSLLAKSRQETQKPSEGTMALEATAKPMEAMPERFVA